MIGGTSHGGTGPGTRRGDVVTALPAVADGPALAIIGSERSTTQSRVLRLAPHVLVWTLLLVPTVRTMARGWRPLSDDANIAIGAWRSLSLHPPLIGVLTQATGKLASNPGPLELWLLGPFVHLDPGQGALLGSAVLCAAVLSLTLYVLVKTAGVWSGVVFSLCVADLALVSPTPFVDPVWNSDFGFFWFLAFLGVAFAIGMGNLRYLALLVFIGSVTVDAHLMYLPSCGIVLVATAVSGFLLGRPSTYRWAIWTAVVTALCWAPSLIQQFTSSRPNLSLLFRSGVTSPGKTAGFVYGLRGLSRAASLLPIWASPRPIAAFVSSGDFYRRNLLLCLVVPLFIGLAVWAYRRNHRELLSLCLVSLGGGLGLVFLFAQIPNGYFVSMVWVNLPVWAVGVCFWLTLGLAAVTAWGDYGHHVVPARVSPGTVRTGVLVLMGLATAAATAVAVFPYGNQFVLDWPATARVTNMAAEIERRVPPGPVGIGVRYRGGNLFLNPASGDEYGLSYLLLTAGWLPGLEPAEDQLLGLPIHPRSPFVVFNEKGVVVSSTDFYKHYLPDWAYLPPGSGS
jgi:hypothetical protein